MGLPGEAKGPMRGRNVTGMEIPKDLDLGMYLLRRQAGGRVILQLLNLITSHYHLGM